ncbi:MAG TPA: hypothetical protein VF789_20590 [Thermoanaerobaculia bacterium]
MCTACLSEKLRMQPTEIEDFVKGGKRDCSLLVRLFKLDERLRFERKHHFIGLNLTDPPERACEGAPLNSIAFADTGGDGIHFSLVSENGEVGDDCMVIMTVPELWEDPWAANIAVGENLHDFLCLGCMAGYAALEKLAFYGDAAIERLQDEEEDDPEAAETLRVMREELGLSPWPNVAEKLASLQAAKTFKLRFARSSFFKTQLRRARNVLRRDDQREE